MLKVSDEKFTKVVKDSKNVRQALSKLGLCNSGGAAYKSFYSRVERLGISTEHFSKPVRSSYMKKIPLSEILIKNSTYTNGSKLKERLIRNNLLKYSCKECKISTWNDKPISLHLDHINGNNKDNRIKNLRLLCPNCHSQTPNYAGKNIGAYAKYSRSAENRCLDCNNLISTGANRCNSCAGKKQKTKIEWPTTKDLIKLLENTSYRALGRKLGVSDNAIRKRIKNHKEQ